VVHQLAVTSGEMLHVYVRPGLRQSFIKQFDPVGTISFWSPVDDLNVETQYELSLVNQR
jgi:hypothetical protein